MSENSIVLMTNAEQMLAKAITIQKAKELKDLALTAKQFATRKGLGKNIILHCEHYAIEAEIRLGELLDKTERNIGARGIGTSAVPIDDHTPPTLIELGITKNESAKAQILAKAPNDIKTKLHTGKIKRSKAIREIKNRKEKAELAEAQKKITEEKRENIRKVCDIRHCSMADLFASGIKPDAVITDPPYPKEFLPLYEELAKLSKDIPLVAAMCGQTYLPEIIAMMTRHLKYRWTIAYLTPGGQSVQAWPSKVNTFWKPVLIFGDSTGWIGDVANSRTNDNDKRFHDWGQSESGMGDLVERLTRPGQLICDPFIGAGTMALVCLRLGRRFIGCDINKEVVNLAIARCLKD